MRVADRIFLNLCVNYEDAALREWYDDGLSFYEKESLAQHATGIESEVCGKGDHELSDVRTDELFVLRP